MDYFFGSSWSGAAATEAAVVREEVTTVTYAGRPDEGDASSSSESSGTHNEAASSLYSPPSPSGSNEETTAGGWSSDETDDEVVDADDLTALHARFRSDLERAPLDELREAARIASCANAHDAEVAGGWHFAASLAMMRSQEFGEERKELPAQLATGGWASFLGEQSAGKSDRERLEVRESTRFSSEDQDVVYGRDKPYRLEPLRREAIRRDARRQRLFETERAWGSVRVHRDAAQETYPMARWGVAGLTQETAAAAEEDQSEEAAHPSGTSSASSLSSLSSLTNKKKKAQLLLSVDVTFLDGTMTSVAVARAARAHDVLLVCVRRLGVDARHGGALSLYLAAADATGRLEERVAPGASAVSLVADGRILVLAIRLVTEPLHEAAMRGLRGHAEQPRPPEPGMEASARRREPPPPLAGKKSGGGGGGGGGVDDAAAQRRREAEVAQENRSDGALGRLLYAQTSAAILCGGYPLLHVAHPTSAAAAATTTATATATTTTLSPAAAPSKVVNNTNDSESEEEEDDALSDDEDDEDGDNAGCFLASGGNAATARLRFAALRLWSRTLDASGPNERQTLHIATGLVETYGPGAFSPSPPPSAVDLVAELEALLFNEVEIEDMAQARPEAPEAEIVELAARSPAHGATLFAGRMGGAGCWLAISRRGASVVSADARFREADVPFECARRWVATASSFANNHHSASSSSHHPNTLTFEFENPPNRWSVAARRVRKEILPTGLDDDPPDPAKKKAEVDTEAKDDTATASSSKGPSTLFDGLAAYFSNDAPPPSKRAQEPLPPSPMNGSLSLFATPTKGAKKDSHYHPSTKSPGGLLRPPTPGQQRGGSPRGGGGVHVVVVIGAPPSVESCCDGRTYVVSIVEGRGAAGGAAEAVALLDDYALCDLAETPPRFTWELTSSAATPRAHMSTLGSFYDALVLAVVRPPRFDYDVRLLGPSSFTFGGRRYHRHDVVLPNDKGERIHCSQWKVAAQAPDQARKTPVVVFLHANSASRAQACHYLSLVLSLGCSLVAFDCAGSGLSDGDYVTLGLREALDLKAVVRWLRGRGEAQSLAVWGQSMGAAAALYYQGFRADAAAATQTKTAAEEEEEEEWPKLDAVVLDSPYSDFAQLATHIANERKAVFGGFTLPTMVLDLLLSSLDASVARRAGFSPMGDLSPLKHAARCSAPALYVRARFDPLISQEHVESLARAYGGPRTLALVEGSHSSPRDGDARKFIARFLARHLPLPPRGERPERDAAERHLECAPWQRVSTRNKPAASATDANTNFSSSSST